MKNFQKSFQHYPWDYMLLIFSAWAIPAIYGLLNRYFIGYMTYESIVVDQSYEAVEVSLEVLLEMFPLAVLALVSWNYTDRKAVTTIVKTALLLQLTITLGYVLFLQMYVDNFIDWINTPAKVRPLAKKYFKLIVLAIPFQAINAILIIAIKSMRKGWWVFSLAFVGVIINFILDVFLISNYSFSLKLGLIGSAWDRLAASVVQFIISAIIFLWLVKKEFSLDFNIEKRIVKSIFKIGIWTGLESLIRNLGYIIGVIAVVNFIEKSEPYAIGGYNTAMWIMWAIMLIPVLAWTEATNIAVGNAFGQKDYQSMKHIQKISIIVVGLYMIGWIVIGNLTWEKLSYWLNGSIKPQVVKYSVLTLQALMFPYILFSIASCIKSFFIGIGRPFWIFLPSFIVNLSIYIPLGIMLKKSIIDVSYNEFLILTNFVSAFDFLITLYVFWQHGYRVLS